MIDLDTPAPADLATLFPNSVEAVRIEIGFGGAEHMIAEAERVPHTGFIGSDNVGNSGLGGAPVCTGPTAHSAVGGRSVADLGSSRSPCRS